MPTHPPALDRQTLLRFLQDIGGDHEALADLLREYLADAPRLIKEVEQAVATAAPAALAAAAHTFKSTSASLGATLLAELCAKLHAQARRGSLAEASELLPRLVTELDRVRTLVAASSLQSGAVDLAALLDRIT